MTRVLVVSDRIGDADPPAAGRALGSAFLAAGAGRSLVAVVPAAAGGADLRRALEALGAEGEWVGHPDPAELGRLLAAALAERPRRLYVDLTVLKSDAGAPLRVLEGAGLTPSGVVALRARPADGREVDLVGVLPPEAATDPLLGIDGVAARQGFLTLTPAAEVLRHDATLAALAADLGVPDAPGLGAARGAALVVAALGGRLATGFELCAAASGLARSVAVADLVVAGTDTFTVGDFGGPVVIGLAALASEGGAPVLALAREVAISTRELRRHGIEAAHALGGGVAPAASVIAERALPVARSWHQAAGGEPERLRALPVARSWLR
nr:hypothetical protein [Propionibacterium sp.]